MMSTTEDLFKAALRADPTISSVDRPVFLKALKTPAADLARLLAHATTRTKEGHREAMPARILRRLEVARMFSVSTRALDRWAQAGLLKKRILPGHKRACGFLASDVQALIEGK